MLDTKGGFILLFWTFTGHCLYDSENSILSFLLKSVENLLGCVNKWHVADPKGKQPDI